MNNSISVNSNNDNIFIFIFIKYNLAGLMQRTDDKGSEKYML